MDHWASLIEKVLEFLSLQSLRNALDAVVGGLVAALFLGRKGPWKLIISGIVAGIAGFLWGGTACDLIMDSCTLEGYRAFSSGVGVISWPVFSILPEVPHIIKKRLSK